MKMMNAREEREKKAGQEREIEREWVWWGKEIDLLNGIKRTRLRLKNIFSF